MTRMVIGASCLLPEERWAVVHANNLVQPRRARGVGFVWAPSRATRSNGVGLIRLGFPRDKQYKTVDAQPTAAADSSVVSPKYTFVALKLAWGEARRSSETPYKLNDSPAILSQSSEFTAANRDAMLWLNRNRR